MAYKQRNPLQDITSQVNNAQICQQTITTMGYMQNYTQPGYYQPSGYQTQAYYQPPKGMMSPYAQEFNFPTYAQPFLPKQQQAYAQSVKNKKTDRTKYKTEMCKNWIEVGSCRYGNKCQFAHGGTELVDKSLPINAKYKSKQCNTFFEELYCPYGSRCLFRHDDRQMDELTRYHYVPKLHFFHKQHQNFSEIDVNQIECCKSFGSSRLPIFQDLCKISDLEETPDKQECRTTYSSPHLSQQTSFYKMQLFTPDELEEMHTDDEDMHCQSIYSDLNNYFSQLPVSQTDVTLARSDTFSSLVDEDEPIDMAHTEQTQRQTKERVNHQQFFITRNHIPLLMLKLNKLNTTGTNQDSVEVEVEEMEKIMLRQQLSQRKKPMRQVKVKESKATENYLERIKTGTQNQTTMFNQQRMKETRATATTYSSQRDYINQNSQQFQMSNFQMGHTDNSLDHLISENTHKSTDSHHQQDHTLYKLAQSKLVTSYNQYELQMRQAQSRRNQGEHSQISFDDYQMKSNSIMQSDIMRERKSINRQQLIDHNMLVNIQEQSESNPQLNSDLITRTKDEEDGHVKILKNNNSFILDSFRPQQYRIKKSIFREGPQQPILTDRPTTHHSKKPSQHLQPQSTRQYQAHAIVQEQASYQKISPKRSHKRQALSMARGSKHSYSSKTGNAYQSVGHQRPLRKATNDDSKESILNSISEVQPTAYTHRKTLSSANYPTSSRQGLRTNRYPPGQLIDKFRTKLNAQQIQTPTSCNDNQQPSSSVQIIMPTRKSVHSTSRGSKVSQQNQLSGRNKSTYISNDLHNPNNYQVDGFFDQRFSSKSNQVAQPEIIQTSRQFTNTFHQRVLSARDHSQSNTKQNLSVDYGNFRKQHTRATDLTTAYENPSENVEEMHNMCVRFHRQLKTIEDDGWFLHFLQCAGAE